MDFNNLSLAIQPKINSEWLRTDYLGALKVRFSIGRSTYQVKPGLYRLGKPGNKDEVFISSNYKLSFDILRRSMKGNNAWVLVLETYGINVWCAAGKGSFGTGELIRQIQESKLDLFVVHKRVIVPQLGAPGVSGFKVKEATGFSVKFGPVRAEDIKEYLSANLKKTPQMSTVSFNLVDRLLLTPVEIVNSLKYLFYAIAILFIISGISKDGYSFTALWTEGLNSAIYLFIGYMAGAFFAPALLPWLPSRYFGGKGLIMGLAAYGMVAWLTGSSHSIWYNLAWFCISGAIASYLAMNFTGASTYTSLSGVKKEMGIFVPLQIGLALTGLIVLIISKFL